MAREDVLTELAALIAAAEARSAAAMPAEDGAPLALTIDHLPVLNYGGVHSGIPIVRRLALKNLTDEVRTDLSLTLSITSPALTGEFASFERRIPTLDAGATTVFDEVSLRLDAGRLAQLDEAVSGTLIVRVQQGDEVIATWSRELRLLAHNEFFHHERLAELIAAHIQPNHPSIVRVLQAAGEQLRESTGDSSLQGYQAGPERAKQIAKGIYEAMRGMRIGYIDPPASFEGTGQKIRTPQQVIEDRLGTCLDLACTYAACLEQAGLHPVICIITGHAYAGLLTEEHLAFPEPTLSKLNPAVNLQDAGVLVPVETVAFTSGNDKPFEEAVEIGRGRWSNANVFRSVVDIHAARRSGVLPLPARVLRDGQITVVVEEKVVQAAPVIVAPAQPVAISKRARGKEPPRITQWKTSLLDLSLRNPLLNLSTKRSGLSILVPNGSIGQLEDLLMAGHGLKLLAADVLTQMQREQGARSVADVEPALRRKWMLEDRVLHVDASEDGVARRVRGLREKAREAEEEVGTNILHLALGSLHWTDPAKAKTVRSPILLMPVRLHAMGRGKPMELRADPVGGTTHNFVLLAKLRQLFKLQVPELETLDGDASGADVMKALDGLRAAIARDRLDMRVDEDAAIALLQFGKYRMWKDFDDHWERFMENPVVRHLVERPGQPFERPVPLPDPATLDTEAVFCPIPCDGTQLAAIVAAAKGASFVLEGPPGTGKSQTITNMIANALAAGKRVLFVAEKRAALTVVKNRLTAIGLGPFCLDVHGKGADIDSLKSQLAGSFTRLAHGDAAAWESNRRDLDARAAALREYAVALHRPGAHGFSVWTAQQRLASLGEGLERRPQGVSLTPEMIAEIRGLLHDLPERVQAAVGTGTNPWSFADASDLADRGDPERLRSIVDQLRSVLAALRTGDAEPLQAMDHATLVAVAALQQAMTSVHERFHPSILSADCSRLRRDLVAAMDAFFLFRGSRVRTAMGAITPHLRKQGEGAAVLGALESAVALQSQIASVPESIRVIFASGPSTVGPALVDFLATLELFRTELGVSEAAVREWTAERGMIPTIGAALDPWHADIDRRLLALRRWGAVVSVVNRLAALGFPTIATELRTGRIAASEIPMAIERGIARVAFDERMRASGLDRFDGLEHQRALTRYLALHATDGQLLREVVPDRLLRARRFKPSEAFGEVGNLKRNVLDAKKKPSVRALMKDYCRAISELAPCFLMSPESVAQFIEPGLLDFDLVIFDEASQVSVPDAIGAIARGRSLVVVGDSRQLPPTAFFGPGGASEEEGPLPEAVETAVPEDLESILTECVGANLDRIWLSWHYRSQEESLIAFSNARYYEGRLSSFPAPRSTASAAGVRWRKVTDGVFDRGKSATNRREAEAVVAEISARLRERGDDAPSMGVVTFNANQAELVTELLEVAAQEDSRLDAVLRIEDPERRLFVKNLENVQGDERDVILISIGFGRDRNGEFPMNFGPLNRAGGERRWNVAVTRARQEVVLFASVEPEEIDLSRVGVGAVGVRHLRAYMEMARDGVARLGDVAALGRQGPDTHREAVAAALRAAGLHVEADIGLSSFKVDIALAHPDAPERQLVAVLLDGPAYAARTTVQDREALPVSVLEKLMRWKTTMRIWLPEWLVERERIIKDARQLVDRLHAEATAPVTATAASLPTDVGTGSRKTRSGRVVLAPTSAVRIAAPDYQPYAVRPGDLGDVAALDAALARPSGGTIARAAEEIVQIEGPTELTYLARLIGRRFGLERVRADRVAAITAGIPGPMIRQTAAGHFVWPMTLDRATWRDFRRTPPGCDRPLERIAPEEIRNAIIEIATKGLSVTDDDLITALAALLDIQRITTALRGQLLRHIASAHEAGVLRRIDDRYEVAR